MFTVPPLVTLWQQSSNRNQGTILDAIDNRLNQINWGNLLSTKIVPCNNKDPNKVFFYLKSEPGFYTVIQSLVLVTNRTFQSAELAIHGFTIEKIESLNKLTLLKNIYRNKCLKNEKLENENEIYLPFLSVVSGAPFLNNGLTCLCLTVHFEPIVKVDDVEQDLFLNMNFITDLHRPHVDIQDKKDHVIPVLGQAPCTLEPLCSSLTKVKLNTHSLFSPASAILLQCNDNFYHVEVVVNNTIVSKWKREDLKTVPNDNDKNIYVIPLCNLEPMNFYLNADHCRHCPHGKPHSDTVEPLQTTTYPRGRTIDLSYMDVINLRIEHGLSNDKMSPVTVYFWQYNVLRLLSVAVQGILFN